MMIRKLIILVAGLVMVSSSAWAYRVIEQVEDGYELALVMVRLPLGESGTIVFRVCEECNTTSLRVTNATRYFANRAPVELGELREIAEAVRATAAGRDRAGIFISYDVASLRVNRVRLSY